MNKIRRILLIVFLCSLAVAGVSADDPAVPAPPPPPAGLGDLLGMKPPAPPPAPPTVPLADQFKALPPWTTALGVVPFYTTSVVSPGWADTAQAEMVRQLIVRKLYRPFGVTDWLHAAFNGSKVASIRDLAKAAKDQYVPVSVLMTGFIFRSGAVYALQVSLYPSDQSLVPTHYLRFFSASSQIPGICGQIGEEMAGRTPKTAKATEVVTRIWVNQAKISFLAYTALQNGEFSFNAVPFLTREGVDYKSYDDYFTHLLGYCFHTTRLAEVTMAEVPAWVDQGQGIKRAADFVVNTQISMTDKLAVASFTVFDVSEGTELFRFKVPLRELTMDYLYQVMRGVAKEILFAVTSDREHNLMGGADYTFDAPGAPDIYCNGYFIGKSVSDLVVPLGLNLFSFSPVNLAAKGDPPKVSTSPTVGLVVNPYINPQRLVDMEPRYFQALGEGVKP